jgi:mono/diheme cytochrome c family protein
LGAGANEENVMKPTRPILAVIGVAVIALPVLAFGQDRTADLGKREFESNCAVCHGMKGKGDGPYAGLGETRVCDLTLLARKNAGVFPFKRVYEHIDGTETVKAHGTREMPIWGTDYRIKAGEYYVDVPYNPEAYVRARILALVEYVHRLQAK